MNTVKNSKPTQEDWFKVPLREVRLMRLNGQAKPSHRMSCRSLNIILNLWRGTERF